MVNPQELIATLKTQHRTLQTDLSLALEDSKSENTGKDISLQLIKFKTDLLEHLKLENGEFYPDYLDKKVKRGEDIVSTKEFIKQMEDIGKIVMVFLDKYHAPEVINTGIMDFRKELIDIIKTLNTRIETEEEGVFDLYLLL
jgi:regulator of sigma D